MSSHWWGQNPPAGRENTLPLSMKQKALLSKFAVVRHSDGSSQPVDFSKVLVEAITDGKQYDPRAQTQGTFALRGDSLSPEKAFAITALSLAPPVHNGEPSAASIKPGKSTLQLSRDPSIAHRFPLSSLNLKEAFFDIPVVPSEDSAGFYHKTGENGCSKIVLLRE